jgi:hypothetical protein
VGRHAERQHRGRDPVVLGIEAIPSRAAIALPMVALVTVFSGLDSFHNWRSRCVLEKFFREQQATWADVSKRWIEFRKLGQSPQSDQVTPNIVAS